MTSPLPQHPDVPLIPAKVYESRDRGDLVLFCGAGVSKNAGRPLFGKLAKLAEDRFGPSAALTKSALEHEQFDQYFQLLEQRVDDAVSQGAVRKFVEEQFRQGPDNLAVHESILKLARDRNGNTRLVTTNYDRHFEEAADRLGLRVRAEFAPRLAKPVKDRWNSIVHVHGGLDGDDLRDLVLTSGDFGRAYITERWAARFASVLFENFDVLFLGYSADDVVMRYLLDAYAAQPQNENERRDVWAIAAPPTKPDEHWQERWMRRRVGLITYDPKHHHKALSDALADWAAVIEKADARRRRVAEILAAGPSGLSTANFHNQLKWLLSDPSGELAEALLAPHEGAKLRVTVEWLDEFDSLELLEQRAERSGNVAEDAMAAKTPLVGPSNDKLALGDRARAFARVLAALAVDGVTRADGRSNSEDVLAWVQQPKRGAALHPQLADLIRSDLTRYGDELRAELRNAWTLVVDPAINIALATEMYLGERNALETDLQVDSEVSLVALKLLHALTPFASFYRSEQFQIATKLFDTGLLGAASSSQQPPLGRARPDLVLRCGAGSVGHLIGKLNKSPRRDALLREAALGVNALLDRALALLRATWDDPTPIEYWQYPRVGSSSDHHAEAWTYLADLAAAAGAALAEAGDRRARALYEAWLAGPHLTQRRLALDAAAKWKHLSDDERMEALHGHSS